jgi:hypothetical protein
MYLQFTASVCEYETERFRLRVSKLDLIQALSIFHMKSFQDKSEGHRHNHFRS